MRKLIGSFRGGCLMIALVATLLTFGLMNRAFAQYEGGYNPYAVTGPQTPKLMPLTLSESQLVARLKNPTEKIELVFYSGDPSQVLVRTSTREGTVTLGGGQVNRLKTFAEEHSDFVTYSTESTMAPETKSMLLNAILLIGGLGLSIGVMVYFQRKMMRGSAAKTSTGSSKAKRMDQTGKRITLEDVAGQDDAKVEVDELIRFLKNPKRFRAIGAKIPKGILLVGPPGTGKTLLARAIAGEARVPFFTISGSDFVEMFVGVGAARVRDMFEEAKKVAPCIIFIDEIDAVGKHRGNGTGGGNDEREQTLNQMLVEMDGFEGNEGIIILAATNRPDTLDPALKRPGRFDRQVTMENPDVSGRTALFRLAISRVKHEPEVMERAEHWAKITPGMSPASIVNCVNEGALITCRREPHNESALMSCADLDEGIQREAMGAASVSANKIMTPKTKRSISYHEMGHGLVALEVGDRAGRITNMPRMKSGGHFMPLDEGQMMLSEKDARNRICMTLGGRAAQWIFFKERDSGCESDGQQANRIAWMMVARWGMSPLGLISIGENDRIDISNPQLAYQIHCEQQKILAECQARTDEIILKHARAFAIASEILVEDETMQGPELEALWGALKKGEMSEKALKAADRIATPLAEGEVAPEYVAPRAPEDENVIVFPQPEERRRGLGARLAALLPVGRKKAAERQRRSTVA